MKRQKPTMTFTLLIFTALMAGAAIALQTGVNSQLRVWLGDPMQSALISFATGTLALAIYVIVQRQPWALDKAGEAPWWVWTGGLLGAFVVAALIVLAPRLGASVLIGLVVAGQMGASLILDHYGALGFPRQAISAPRLLGTALLIIGVVLIRKF